jgi:hypothetical protein
MPWLNKADTCTTSGVSHLYNDPGVWVGVQQLRTGILVGDNGSWRVPGTAGFAPVCEARDLLVWQQSSRAVHRWHGCIGMKRPQQPSGLVH